MGTKNTLIPCDMIALLPLTALEDAVTAYAWDPQAVFNNCPDICGTLLNTLSATYYEIMGIGTNISNYIQLVLIMCISVLPGIFYAFSAAENPRNPEKRVKYWKPFLDLHDAFADAMGPSGLLTSISMIIAMATKKFSTSPLEKSTYFGLIVLNTLNTSIVTLNAYNMRNNEQRSTYRALSLLLYGGGQAILFFGYCAAALINAWQHSGSIHTMLPEPFQQHCVGWITAREISAGQVTRWPLLTWGIITFMVLSILGAYYVIVISSTILGFEILSGTQKRIEKMSGPGTLVGLHIPVYLPIILVYFTITVEDIRQQATKMSNVASTSLREWGFGQVLALLSWIQFGLQFLFIVLREYSSYAS